MHANNLCIDGTVPVECNSVQADDDDGVVDGGDTGDAFECSGYEANAGGVCKTTLTLSLRLSTHWVGCSDASRSLAASSRMCHGARADSDSRQRLSVRTQCWAHRRCS